MRPTRASLVRFSSRLDRTPFRCVEVPLALLACLLTAPFAPAAVAARTLRVVLRPEAVAALRARCPVVLRSNPGPAAERAPVVVLPLLLEGAEEAVSARAPWPARVLGTGFYHGQAIAHLGVLARDLDSSARDRMEIELETIPSGGIVARPRRPDAARARDVGRELGELVLDPGVAPPAIAPLRASAALVPGDFHPSEIPSLEGSPVQMLVLTRDTLVPAFQEYADYRTGLGIPTVVRSVEWVTQNCAHGADLAETLRDFVRQAYELWGIRSLLIGGDTELVPTRYASSIYSLEGETVPTDLYYACLDGNWNADGDSRWAEGYASAGDPNDMADLYPELYVGRLPVTTAGQVSALLDKLGAYTEPSATDYQGKMLFLAEVIWPSSYKPGDPILKNGADNAQRLILQNGLEQSGWTCTRLYETPAYYPGSSALTRAAALAAMQAGYGLVTDIGHGFRYTMSLGDASLTNVQALGLANGTQLFFLNMLNCSAAAFDFPCLAEKFLVNPGGGAIGVIGAAREAYPDNIQLFQEAWFAKLLTEGCNGAAQALHAARLRYVSQTYDDGAYRWSNFITAYLGDPELGLWLGNPRLPEVSAAASLPVGSRSFRVTVAVAGTPVAGATVCLWKPGDFYAFARTNLAGAATLSLAAGTTGTAQLSVSGAGLRPHRASIAVVPTAGVALRSSGAVQVEDSGTGTVGNGNGRLEAGETARLRFWIENRGGALASAATLQVGCSDPALVASGSAVALGDVAPGASVLSPPVTVTVAGNVLDQYRLGLDLLLRAQPGWSVADRIDVELLQVTPRVQRLWVDDKTFGNGNGVPDANETYELRLEVKNYGFATLEGATGQLAALDPDVTVLNATTSFGTVPHLGIASGSFRVREANVAQPNRLELAVLDVSGRSWSFDLETRRPQPPAAPAGDASVGPGMVQLTWSPSSSADVAGYVVYRAPQLLGPWTRASADMVQSTTSFRDDGLQPGGRYYYCVAAVDSSGNESVRTASLDLTTNPALLAGWPQQLGMWSNSSPVTADLDGDLVPEIVVGASDYLYAWRPDGSELYDGDGNPLTPGVFSPIAGNFMPGLAAGDLDRDGRDEVVACTFDTKQVYVFEGDGSVRAGWPHALVSTTHGIWATPALGDLDLDGRLEVVVLGLDGRLYAWRADGTELRDGDSNPATQGVFFVIPGSANWSRGGPAIADLVPADATPEIIFATESTKKIYVLRADGSVAPGWPRTVGGKVDAAPSLGDVDGDGGLEIAVPACDGKLYVLRADGTDLPGWPRPLPNVTSALTPSVALCDFDGDGKLEIVAASSTGTSEGSLYCFDWQGNVRPGWPVDVHSGSEASPIVGDLDGDGTPEIVYGGESGVLQGFRPDGRPFPGFPIRVGAEVRATPLMTDADADGHVDLVFSGWDQLVYIWKFPALFRRHLVPWGTFKGNALRNGVFDYREPTDAGSDLAPRASALQANFPNPFNPTTVIRFEVGAAASGRVQLAIYDVRGRRLRTVLDRALQPGRYLERWDGRDDVGRQLASGVYFCRIETADLCATRKLALIR